MATVQEVYVALFGRPADPIGLQFWQRVTSNGANLAPMLSVLAPLPEYQNRFAGLTPAQQVNTVYQALFDRDAEPSGLTFFVDRLLSGELTLATLAVNILDGAQGSDAQIVANKVAAANSFTANVDTTAEILAYAGEDAAEAGRAFLNGITADPASVPSMTEVEAAIAAIVAGEFPTGPGETFTLTNATNPITGGVDVVTGTAGDDLFRALAAGSLDSGDVLAGGGGTDTLSVALGALVDGAAPVTSGIERFFVNFAANVTLDASAIAGAQQIWSIAAANATFRLSDADLGTIFGAQDYQATAAYDIDIAGSTAGASDVLQLAVDDVDANAVVFLSSTDAAEIEALAISALGDSGPGAVPDEVDVTAFTQLETVTIAGAGDIAVAVYSGGADDPLVTFDASAASGRVIANLAGLENLASVATGSGSDSLLAVTDGVSVSAGAGDDLVFVGAATGATVDAGSGDDTIQTNAGAGQSLGGGSGADLFQFGAIQNITTATVQGIAQDLVTVTDFDGTSDVLDIPALTDALTNLEAAAIAAEPTLFAAVGAAASFVGPNSLVAFVYGSDTYIYANDADAALSAGDGLVQLAGYTGALIDGVNLV